MNVELQQLPVFDTSGEQEDTVWVAIVGNTVLDRPNHSRSPKAVKEHVRKLDMAKTIDFTIHPQCQTKQHKKGRRE